MIRSVLLAIAMSALLFIANAAFSYEATSYSETPVQVLTSTTDATNFQYPFVSRFINSSYIVLWGFYGDSDTTPITYNAVRRLLNATDLTTAEDDSDITLNITLTSTPLFAYSADGYVAVAGTAENSSTTNTTTFIGVYLFSSDTDESSEIETVSIASTTNTSIGYTPYNLWAQNGYFYLVYAQTVNDVENDLFLVAFKRDGGDFKWDNPIQLNTDALSGNANVQGGQPNGGTGVIVAWRKDTQGQVVFVEIGSGGAVTSEAVIATDNGNNKFAPASIVFSEEYYVIVLSETANGATTGFSVSFSGSNVTETLGFALTNGYSTYSVSAASGYYNGWFVITRQSTENGNTVTGDEETLQLYNYTNTSSTTDTNATTTDSNTQLVLATDGSVIQGFTLPNQSYYVLVLDSLDGETGAWTAGYIGQVFNQISDTTFGAVLRAALAAISTIIALLFVF